MKLLQYLLVGLATISFIGSCQSTKQFTPALENKEAAPIKYSLVYIIHGDADYLYHEDGEGKQADEQVIKNAKAIAREAKQGEVFIFHQRPEKKILWLLPKKDRLFYYYRNGELVHQQKYSPSKESFTTEASFFNRLSSNGSKRKFLLYYGHEVPSQDRGYHHSRKHAVFNKETFTKGLSQFLRADEKFDLAILSTCDNGTPDMVSQMTPYSNALLASPKNLHLSHIDSDSVLKLEKNPNVPELQVAEAVAEDTFQRLDQFIQTAVTLSVYDLQKDREKVRSLGSNYKKYQSGGSYQLDAENVDCAVLPFWEKSETPGVHKVFYKPPRFGTKNPQSKFSGWGCKEVITN